MLNLMYEHPGLFAGIFLAVTIVLLLVIMAGMTGLGNAAMLIFGVAGIALAASYLMKNKMRSSVPPAPPMGETSMPVMGGMDEDMEDAYME